MLPSLSSSEFYHRLTLEGFAQQTQIPLKALSRANPQLKGVAVDAPIPLGHFLYIPKVRKNSGAMPSLYGCAVETGIPLDELKTVNPNLCHDVHGPVSEHPAQPIIVPDVRLWSKKPAFA